MSELFPVTEGVAQAPNLDRPIPRQTLWLVLAWYEGPGMRYWKIRKEHYLTQEAAQEAAEKLSHVWSHQQIIRVEARP